MNPVLSDSTAVLYRLEDRRYAPPLNEYEEPVGGGRTEIVSLTFVITKYTAAGAWVSVYGEQKFVNLRASKQFACSSIDEARESFVRRKNRQIAILTAQLHFANEALEKLNNRSPWGPT